jgi:hypothetical protein
MNFSQRLVVVGNENEGARIKDTVCVQLFFAVHVQLNYHFGSLRWATIL